MYMQAPPPPEGYEWVPGRCPNARNDGVPVACNCIGLCHGKWVKKKELTTDADS